jgi:hypothetical protein
MSLTLSEMTRGVRTVSSRRPIVCGPNGSEIFVSHEGDRTD